ncbi:MAG: hypothetical protein R3C32_07450 [Chloroflexota bacterium]
MPGELAHHAAQLRLRGVSTTTFGVGDDFQEALLQGMAQAGGGHFRDIADAASIADHVSSEIGESLEVVARRGRAAAHAAEGVRVEPGRLPRDPCGRGTPGRARGPRVGPVARGAAPALFPVGKPGETHAAVIARRP